MQATSHSTLATQPPAEQAGPQAEQAQHPFQVLDALCPDGIYLSPAVQAVAPHHGGEAGPPWPPRPPCAPIPQVDGVDDHDQPNQLNQGLLQTYQCETCYEIFENRELYEEHDQAQFCCDECNICYITQIEADFHNLQVHPDEHYTRTYISESTKLLFASRK